jgi:hypothetical protein
MRVGESKAQSRFRLAEQFFKLGPQSAGFAAGDVACVHDLEDVLDDVDALGGPFGVVQLRGDGFPAPEELVGGIAPVLGLEEAGQLR